MAKPEDDLLKYAQDLEGSVKKGLEGLGETMKQFQQMSKGTIPDSVRKHKNMVIERHGEEVRVKFSSVDEATKHIQFLIDAC